MNTRQIIAYAKENGFNTVKFSIRKNGNHLVAGKFLDAYFEFVEIPLLGDGFITIGQLENELGYDIEFGVLTDDEFVCAVRFDFILRGKTPPEKYAIEGEESEVAKRREGVENSPVDCSTPNVTDSKGDTE